MTSNINESINPAIRLVLAALRVNGTPVEPDFGYKKSELSQAFTLARQHGVFPLLYQYVRKQKADKSIMPLIESHKHAYLGNVGRNLQLTQRLLNIIDLLSRNGIRAIPFKGPVLAVQAYGDIGLRSFCDLDLLIRSRDFPRVYDLMESTGYRSIKPMIVKMKTVWKKTRRSFEFQGENFSIDFHQQVTQGPRSLRLRVDWNKLSHVELNGHDAPCLNLEDSVLALAMHGTHHGWAQLKLVADLAFLLHAHQDEVQWQQLLKKAQTMGVLRMVWIGICLGREFCDLIVPDHVKELLEKDKKLAELLAYFKDKVLAQQKSNLIPQTALPRSLDSWRHKVRYLSYYLFNPTSLDMLAVRLPTILYPLYFVIRPARLLLNLARGRELS
jgi:hypothetical protein